MAASKSKAIDAGVSEFLAGLTDPERKQDCIALIEMMKKASKCAPKMWGSMVGFGDLHYRYESGREGDTFLLGFASRKPELTLHLGCGLQMHGKWLEQLGKHKAGKGCLYLRRLADVDLDVLRNLLADAAAANAKMAVKPKTGG
jgi:hypothetical protein